jgi:molecular chaperone GrpE
MEENKEIEKEDEVKKKHKPNKNEEIELLKGEIESLNNEVLRSKADLINYRKRKDEETSNLLKYCNSDLILLLLNVVDNFERALVLDDEAFKSYLDGFRLIYNQVIDILNGYEVKEIEALDKVFDPMYHQSVATKKDDTKESGVVLEVFKKGYTYKDKVLRPAMVIINE